MRVRGQERTSASALRNAERVGIALGLSVALLTAPTAKAQTETALRAAAEGPHASAQRVEGGARRPPASSSREPIPAPSSQPSADAAVARGMGDATTPSTKLLLALQQIHLTQCATKVQQASNFLFEGQDANFIVQPLGPDADRWPTVIVIESNDPAGGHSRLSTLMVGADCSGMYQQVIYWPKACSYIKSTVFAGFTGERALLREVQVSDAGAALQLYLTPAGSGCISIKKELFR